MLAATDAKTAVAKAAYLKNVCQFYGLKSKVVEELHDLHIQPACVSSTNLWAITDVLLANDYHEMKQAGCYALHRNFSFLKGASAPDTIQRVSVMFDTGNVIFDWATCDSLASRVLGRLLREEANDQGAVATALRSWASAPNTWKRRAACVAFMKCPDPKYGLHTLALEVCGTAISGCSERFVQLGAGWCVREMSVHHPAAAEAFIRARLPDITREGLRYALEKTNGKLRSELMDLHASVISEQKKVSKSGTAAVGIGARGNGAAAAAGSGVSSAAAAASIADDQKSKKRKRG